MFVNPLSVESISESSIDFSIYSLDNWGGFSSLNNFDNFYGVNNFDGSRSEQIIIEEEEEQICEDQDIEIIQQRLVVLQEMVQRYKLTVAFSRRDHTLTTILGSLSSRSVKSRPK